MNDLPRRKLAELVDAHGPTLGDDPRRCRALLKEQCAAHKDEIDLLVAAAKERVPQELHAAPAGATEELLARLTQHLRDELDVPPEDARWAVEAWAMALTLLPRLPPEEAPPAPAGDPAIEQPACFYLGREYDLASSSVDPDKKVMYDARDLLTHGVVVGMTGSGKTGLCISLIEEAAIDGLPCIIIDPKGDLTNLLLQFPELRPDDFRPWLNPEDARHQGVSLEVHAEQLAERWRRGLAETGQTPERIARLHAESDFRVYTPGSEAGLPLSILQTFAAPKGSVSREALHQKIDATVTALLGLTGISADPVQSREHILIAQLLLHAWGKGRDLTLAQLIEQIQAPALAKVGTLDVDTFYPEKERLKLAVALNNILASPSFSTWISGEALDLGKMIVGPGGKPRQLIFYVAHLDDAQRLFFITLLLEEVLSWMRKQPGTTSLRAILYFDEVFGYLPPHPANPPTKGPLMTLLKQARAFGVGVLLATQNPVDLDYKALSNAGTWFVGKLQTERDKARLLEGLEGVAAASGTLSNRAYLERVISALGNRVFLLHNVHRGQPRLFQSRWALSFLRGPMTSDQVSELMRPFKERESAGAQERGSAPADGVAAEGKVTAIPLCQKCGAELAAPGLAACPGCGAPVPASVPAEPAETTADRQFLDSLELTPAAEAASVPGAAAAAPEVPGVPQFYVALSSPVAPPGSAGLVYQPRLLGLAEVLFADRKKGVECRGTFQRLALPPSAPGAAVAWHTAETFTNPLAAAAQAGARWADVPDTLDGGKKLKILEREFLDHVYRNARLPLYTSSKVLGLVSRPGEELAAFLRRCNEEAARGAEEALAQEREKFRERFRKYGVELPEEKPPQPGGSWSLAGAVFDFLAAPLSSPTAHLSPVERGRLKNLEDDWQQKRREIAEKWRRIGAEHAETPLAPRKTDVRLLHFGLAWAPFWQVGSDLVPAYR